jgi:transitional endoplasmic reticulum ATPase
MPEHGQELRPDIENFECVGCGVALVDAAGILTAAEAGPVELLRGAAFPAPVRRVTFSVSTGVREGQPVHLLAAEIFSGAAGLPHEEFGSTVLGMTGPVGVLLARRAAAGDKLAARIADGVGLAAARLGLGRAGGGVEDDVAGSAEAAVIREVEAAGLRAVVSQTEVPSASGPAGGRITTLQAVVPSASASSAHLRAMCQVVLQAVSELVREAGDGSDTEPLAGRDYVLERRRAGRRSDPDGLDDVDLDQVGGLPDVVAQFRQIAVSFRHPQAMARWGARRPQGILMYGPPGTGKTMLARALANEIGAKFREIRTPEILDKWLGGSERNIKRVFQDARRYREPTVMLFDEFDSIISYVGEGMDAASQAVNAVAGIFKQEMNGLIEDNPNVIVVATTNFPQRVDESLIRSGRFDVKISIPVPGEAGRAEIFTKMLRELIMRHEMPGFRMFADDVDPPALARASAGMTGADIKEVLRRVQLAKAMQEAGTGTVPPPISQDDLVHSIQALRQGAAA